jgi:acetylornithine deacetylase/succinyl-diaminopimelate desuccinylase-like protein
MTPATREALAFIDARKSELIEFLRVLVATPSITIDMGERAIAGVVITHARALGIADPEVLWAREDHPNLLFRHQGPASGHTLILNGHLDTQPVGDGVSWSRPPFGGQIVGDRLYGLGSSDMKGGVAAMIYALAALVRSGASRGGALLLALVANEEDGGAFGADWLARQSRLRGDACVIAEPAGVRQEWEAICNAQRGQSAVWVQVLGQQMHSGIARAFGAANAAVHMARAIEALDRELVIRLADGGADALADHTVGVLVRCGEAWGICPGVAEFGIDVRTLPGMERGDIARGLDAALARLTSAHPEIRVSWRFNAAPLDWIAPTLCLPEHAVVRAAQSATAAVLGTAPPLGVYPATTDSSAFATVAGIPTIAALGPGRIALAHKADEYVTLSSVIEAAKIYVLLAVQYLNQL